MNVNTTVQYENDITPTRIGFSGFGEKAKEIGSSIFDVWKDEIHTPDSNCAISIILIETMNNSEIEVYNKTCNPEYLKLYILLDQTSYRMNSILQSENKIICLSDNLSTQEELVSSVINHLIRGILKPDILGFEFGDFYKLFYKSNCYAIARRIEIKGFPVFETIGLYTELLKTENITTSGILVLYFYTGQDWHIEEYEKIRDLLKQNPVKPRYIYPCIIDDNPDTDNVDVCLLFIP